MVAGHHGGRVADHFAGAAGRQFVAVFVDQPDVMPFGGLAHGVQFVGVQVRVQDAGATAFGHAVKLEGGSEIKDSIKKILNAGIPVMGHLGLTPQSIYKFGTYTVRAKEDAEAEKLIEDAKLSEKLG